jgi:hypothetical protein
MVLPFVGSERGNFGTREAVFGYVFGADVFDKGTSVKQYFGDGDEYTAVYCIPNSLKSVSLTDEELLGWGAFYLKKLKHHEATEQQRKKLEEEKGKLSKEYIQTKEQLAEKEALLTQKQKEILLLQQRLESLSSDAVHVLTKAKQIISDKQHEIKTNLKMEDSDWLLLLQKTDSRLDGALTHIQQKYQLSDKEIRFCCLFLTDIPVSHLCYLFERSSSYPYRIIRPLFDKLGIEYDSSTYKEAFQFFIANLE